MKEWIHEAEASGIHSLREFADQLKTYRCAPPTLEPLIGAPSPARRSRNLSLLVYLIHFPANRDRAPHWP